METRAIVIGAGIAGLVAARVLADHYDRVTILERDSLPPHPDPRKGVPQGRHPHALLGRGRDVLEDLFPGLTEELVGNGAVPGDISADSIWFNYGRYLASGPSDLRAILLSRPKLEHHVRQRVLTREAIRLFERAPVQGLVTDETSNRVLGVILAAPLPGETDPRMAADLIVDASGRHSRAPQWLAALGYAEPAEETIDVDIGYTTRVLRRLPQHLAGKRGALIAAQAPNWRFGVALAIEDDRWIVTVGGYFGDAPPADDAAFLAFARTLAAPDIADLLATAEPLSSFATFRFPASRRCRYERLGRFPASFLVMGDALCSFNPIYGQGMTVAALEGLVLRDCLANGSGLLAQRFFIESSPFIDVPWQIAAGSDLLHPRLSHRQSFASKVLNWYVGKVHQAAATDVGVAHTFLGVANLKTPPSTLFGPAMMLKVVRGILRWHKPLRAIVRSSPQSGKVRVQK